MLCWVQEIDAVLQAGSGGCRRQGVSPMTVVWQTAKHVAAGQAERVSMLQRKMLRAEHSKIQELVSAAIGKQYV